MAISVRTCRTTASIVALILSSGVQQPHAREMGRHNASDCVDGFIHLMFGRSRLFSATRSRVNSALAAVNRAWAFAQPRQIFQSGLVLIEFAVGQAIDHMLIGKGGDPLSDEPEMRGKLCCGDAGSRPCPSPHRQGNSILQRSGGINITRRRLADREETMSYAGRWSPTARGRRSPNYRT